ncbi:MULTISPECIES: MarR family winged helix-turn-helix transcriptional regulator [Dactylosporangium]|uniref:HTH-type transcriptional regulator YcgE n=2 Tax=Dactylosporangium TaxID=35753 RepID=A0A9W6KSF7_9ACTN|nr:MULTISPECIES: MarR family winged helix-turn-helix transcriptional regulator [Dactylosporangium]UAB92890.1 winged helix-turn-helix transcriptional regulator [Dactylosporangium vinaceum]UWZ41311.1 winged helix-turn-helix transcriptional regulator [Dactylosporangium matsuzakiense]GLL05691.1 putative HTH-type transcriptional regulator YcgE [Dactylosporangium matsuzakiense]
MSSESAELLHAIGDASRSLQAAVDAFDDAVTGLLGINRTDLRCLDELMQAGEASPAQLAARLRLTTGSTTTLLDRLERAGYVTRSPDRHDRRKVVVRPTPLAQQRAMEVYGPVAADGAHALADFSAGDLEAVLRYLRISREVQQRHLQRIRPESD